MKITKIEIKNFRSLHDVTIYPNSILTLVGRNNSGKSNITKALALFFDPSIKNMDSECFYNHKTDKPIQITLTFEKLSSWEKDQFKVWMDGERLVVGREIVCKSENEFEIINLAFTKVPEPEWLQEDLITGDKIAEWWGKKAELKISGIDFFLELGSAKPGVAKWKEVAKQFLNVHKDKIPWKDERRDNPKGYPGVLKGALPEFVYVPAIRDVVDEAKVSQTSPFGKLINSVLEKIADKEKEAIAGQLKKIENKLNRAGGNDRVAEVKAIEDQLNRLIREIMECDIEIEMGVPQLKEIFGGVKIYANDGVRTIIDTKGHGLQRSMIFTILRAYAELSHLQKAVDKAGERTTIFAIEEPELYLHPHLQRNVMNVFRNIAKGKDQVIYSTHSSLFVDIAWFDEICIVRRDREGDEYKSKVTQLPMEDMLEDLKVRKGIDGNEAGIREQYSNAFNPLINEGFFASKVVIVEGPSEQYLFPIYSEAMGYNLDQNNVSVVHSDGKGSMDRLLRVFNGFKIPTYLWFDGDKDNADSVVKKKTLELLELLGNKKSEIGEVGTEISDCYAVLEYKLEKTLREEIEDYDAIISEAAKILGPIGKPLEQRYLAVQIRKKIDNKAKPEDVIPKTIIDIIGKIKNLEFNCSVLRK
ncbi:MAG: ATP-dependent endonuclease [Candidatus Omnitrophica bacterium]|nr:ATP-dependent endonuclease [Candidatus Margulisiibacteriota bacterium]MBU1868867.1 ATP-dependent endonuclease [Candidatus Omnitrophota bacterium]